MAMAKLVLTCRPGAHLEYHVFDRITEIYGFDELRIHQYVSMFCEGNAPGDVDFKSQVNDYIDSNINLRSFCYVPFFCNLICRIAKMKLEQTIEDPLPTTVTQLLTMSVRVLAIEHHPDFRGRTLDEEDDVIARIKDSLLHHCTLAKNGISCQPIQVLFSEEDIVSCGLSQDTAIKCGLLTSSREIHRQGLSVEERRLYSFLHLIVEEFLAGIVLLSDIHQTENLLRRTQHEGQIDMTLTFMSGLMGDQDNRDFLESLGYRTTTSAVELLRLVVNRELENRRRDHKAIVLLLLILISESRQPELWAEIKAFVMADGNKLDLSERHISPIEMQALIYVMPSMLDTFVLDMSSCSLKGTDLVAGLRGLTQLTHLRLSWNEDLHGLDVMTVLCSSLKEMINLEELDLSGCQLNDEDVFELSSVLITLRRLMEINLQSNSIGDNGALRVTEVVCTLPRLTHLWLGYNWLTEDVIFLVRRTVHICFPRGLVQMLALDTQRPPGQEFRHPDLVVDCQWQVTNLEVGLRRLLSRPVVDREWYWAQEVVLMKGHLAVVQDWLRLAEDRRAAASEGHGDNLFYVIRGQQIQRRFRALEQDRPQ